MFKSNILVFLLPVLALLFSSCSLETDNNAGDLEGMWHLVRIEESVTNTHIDVSNEVIFWSFQAKLLQMEDKTGQHYSYLYRFRIDNDQLTLTSPYQFDRENGDRPLTAYESTLGLYGIKSLTPVFHIEKIDRRKMILNDGAVRLYFDKF
ncbi:lipocalin-like domain-containing protein [Prevotella sp.]|uniref:lipocalin-like domain-containing protein n=1 Tax=Prevotella sp. TaxID=59823 RepID=UPI001CB669C1|nr:lipocalin-like domain-containing protein [Prevotella sp.]MBF1628010.1 lipocalin-like domain-containing protein [Prevotella sp.]